MARRRRPDPVIQKVRQLARSGRRAAAGELLEDTLRQNPNHSKAQEEYRRFLTDRPFTFEERDYEELQSIISSFLTSPQMLSSMRGSSIRKLRKRIHYLQRVQEHMLSIMEKKTLSQLRTNITRELKRRRKPLGKVFIILGILLLILLLIAGSVFFLYKRAGAAAEKLDQANSGIISRAAALNLLKIHDTGLNRTLDRRVGSEADKLRSYLRAQEQRIRECDSLLRELEKSDQSVVKMGVRRRADIERKLKELGTDGAPYMARWAALCEAEKDELNQQRLTLSEELLMPLPPLQELTGEPETDFAELAKRQKILQKRLNIFDDAAEALQLSRSIIEPTVQEFENNKHILAEISQLKNLLQLLPSAHDYDSYRKLLTSWNPQHYASGKKILSIIGRLPELKKLRMLMQEHGQNVKPGLLLAARKSLIEGKASFSADFPASREQLMLLNELLANSALATRLYEHIDTATNERALSEEPVVVRYGRACFPRSQFDPQRDEIARKNVEWHNPTAVVSRTLDPQPLHQRLGLNNRTGFYTNANLPALLTSVFRIEGRDIPALARAYVLHHLIKANNAAKEPILSGMQYAPATRRVFEEFEKLRKSCEVKLDGDCWLQFSARHQAAERRYAHWFAQHREVNFQEELRKNLNSIMQVTPSFCGYINEKGEIILFTPLHKDKLLWYLSEDGAMTASAQGVELKKPLRLSPVFIVEKQY